MLTKSKTRRAAGKWLLPILLLVETLFLAGAFETHAVVMTSYILAALGAAIVLNWRFAKHQGEQHSNQTLETGSGNEAWLNIMILSTISLIVALIYRSGDYAGTGFNPIALAVDSLAHGALFVSLVLWVFYPNRGHPMMLAVGLVVIMLSMAAGAVSQSFPSQIAVAITTMIVFCLTSRWILSQWFVRNESHPDEEEAEYLLRGQAKIPLGQCTISGDADPGHLGLLFTTLTVTVFMMATTGIAHVTSIWLPDVQSGVYKRLQDSLEATDFRSIIGGTGYVRGSRIGSVRQHMTSDPIGEALFAKAESEPGYLRGTAFDVYQNGQWFESHKIKKHLVFSPTPDMLSRQVDRAGEGETKIEWSVTSVQLYRFPIAEEETESAGTVVIQNIPTKGFVYFTPLSMQWIEANANSLTVTQHNVIEQGIRVASPYVVDVAKNVKPESLSPRQRRIMTYVPENIRESVSKITNSVTRGRLTPRSKAMAIEAFFQDNFDYSLTPAPVPPRVDPIQHFLESQHPAHCEYFASATMMMLRSVDVPTRYVTGYVMKEYDAEKDRWIARNRDAHAWVEAYDEISGTWFPVESTVGRQYFSLFGDADMDSSSSAFGDEDDELFDDDSFIVRMMGILFAMRATDPLIILFRFAQVPLFLVVIFLIWKRYGGRGSTSDDPNEQRAKKMLKVVDQKLKRQKLIRRESETLHQFSRRVESSVDQQPETAELLQNAANWYRHFANERYQGRIPEAFDVASV